MTGPDPVPKALPPARRRWPLAAAAVVLAGGIAGGAYWWLHRPPGLPPGIAFSNGRLEADEIDVSTKFAGRVSEILADEGTMVRAGQVVARIDTRDLRVQLAQARSLTIQAQQSVVQNQADLVQMGSQLKLTVQQLQRARALVTRDTRRGRCWTSGNRSSTCLSAPTTPPRPRSLPPWRASRRRSIAPT